MTSVLFSMSLNTIYGQQNAVPSSELGEAVALQHLQGRVDWAHVDSIWVSHVSSDITILCHNKDD